MLALVGADLEGCVQRAEGEYSGEQENCAEHYEHDAEGSSDGAAKI